ncbi:uncharacterized protein [Clytia hemisphaerica]|uniref:uncharacterized protein n=1 Tax=Clytia hemisphaerica TaxID=252671 RepID=UPI0034D6C68D
MGIDFEFDCFLTKYGFAGPRWPKLHQNPMQDLSVITFLRNYFVNKEKELWQATSTPPTTQSSPNNFNNEDYFHKSSGAHQMLMANTPFNSLAISVGKNAHSSTVEDNWSEIDEFKDWIARSSVNTQARCKRCHKTFELSNMGVRALRSHASGKKHKEITQKVSSFFKTRPVKESSHEQQSKEDNERTKKAQTSIESTLTSADVTKAEIRWALDGILKGNSNNQNANISPLLNACFPGHETIKLFTLGADKLRYSCNYGLAPYFRSILQDEVKKSEIYVMSFDESLNDVNQKCQMDLIVRYWDEKTQQVKVRYWDCSYLGHSTQADLLEHFSKTTESLDPSKMVQVSMDGLNVNLKFLKTLISSREEINVPSLVDIGTCPLHTVNNSFQVGAKNAEWDLKKTLKGIWQIFHDSPARREDYEKETGSTVYPKTFCSTRWTENKPTAERAISIWPYIEQIVTYWEKKPPNKRPKSKSYANVKTAVNDPLTVVKLKFFAYVAGILEPFLKMYQTDKPMIPFLYFDLKSIVLTLMKLFIKPNCLSGAKTGMQLCGIDLENHGQASVERGFSLRNASLKDNISELSIDSKHVIVDHMLSNDLKPETMDINTPLMLWIEINEIKLKIASLKKNVSYLDDEFTNSILQAEDQNVNEQSLIISKATALKRKSISKSEEAEQLENKVKMLEAKRKNL